LKKKDLFSYRLGFRELPQVQLLSISEVLKIRLWNVVDDFVWHLENEPICVRVVEPVYKETCKKLAFLLKNIWDFFSITQELTRIRNILQFPESWEWCRNTMKRWFQTEINWLDICDFLEFCAKELKSNILSIYHKFIDRCNKIFEEEMFGYRFIDTYLEPITSEVEIQKIREVLETHPLEYVRGHIKAALKFLSAACKSRDVKEKQDFARNSIKESISALESLCRSLTGQKKIKDFSAALNELEKKGIVFHGALKKGTESIWGWTSDEHGIRHCMMDDPNLGIEDAVFVLVTCSALINYLTEKARKKGLVFNKIKDLRKDG